MTMTLELPTEIETLPDQDTEAITAIQNALNEDPSEEVSLEDYATRCGVKLCHASDIP